MNKAARIKFGDIVVVANDNLLIVDGKDVAITPKTMAVLMLLLKHQGQTLSKAFIFEQVWQDVVVSDTALSRVIADLRQALGDSARAPKYIKTVSKKGFHTVAPVVDLLDESDGPQTQPHLQLNQQKPIAWITLLVLICICSVTTALLLNFDSAAGKQTFRPQFISNTFDVIRRPTFSFDGSQLTYSKSESGSIHKVVVQTLAKNLTQTISQKPWRAGLARFSSKQNSVFFMSQTHNACVVKQYDLTNKTASDIYDCSAKSEYFAYDVSPDHQFMAVAIASIDNDVAELKIVELASNAVMFEKTGQLSSTNAMMYPRYSPSGDKLAIVTMDVSNQNHNLLVLDIQTQQFTHHETQASVMFDVTWGADDNSLYYLRNKDDLQGIWHLDLSSGEQQLIYSESILDFDYDAQHHRFALTKQVDNSAIYASSLDAVLQDIQKESWEISPLLKSKKNIFEAKLSPDGQLLAYISNEISLSSVFTVAYRAGKHLGEPKLRYQSSGGRITHINWTQNGEALLVNETVKGPITHAAIRQQNQNKLISLDGQVSAINCAGQQNVVIHLVFADMRMLCTSGDEPKKSMFVDANQKVTLMPHSHIVKAEFFGEHEIAYSIQSKSDIMYYDVRKHTNQVVHLSLGLTNYQKLWDVSEQGIYYVNRALELSFYDRLSNENTIFGEIKLPTQIASFDLDVHQSSNQLFYPKRTQRRNDLILLEKVE